ncbi:MAG: hypothetical protein RSE97_08410 [Oscillospiraceae bacterium]
MAYKQQAPQWQKAAAVLVFLVKVVLLICPWAGGRQLKSFLISSTFAL